MGIPGLARHLEPYARHHSPEKLQGYCAIIDGPALAYHAHKLVLAASASKSKIPSYADIVTHGVRWLESLENIGIEVSMVFFDGALPLEKRPERLFRTEQNNKRVQQLRTSYPTAACPIPTLLGSRLYAFLAPALREALSESAFASRTCMVLGEADDWCALYAQTNERPIIFTSDTDLILFNYAPETLISFLQDCDLSVSIRAYSPHQIRQMLELNSLTSFAFALNQDRSKSTKDLVQKAKVVDEHSHDYRDFRKRYISEFGGTVSHSRMPIPTPQLQDLDVRVSELVYQCQNSTEIINVYLPLLVEDPNQASAWAMGQNIRTLTYSLLVPRNSIIHEYKRKAQGIAVEKIHTFAFKNVQTPAVELHRQISALMKWAGSKPIESAVYWPLFALSLVLIDMSVPPTMLLIIHVLNGDFNNKWYFIQVTARLQAVLYSLRMLKQVIKVWLAVNEKPGNKFSECLSELEEYLNTLPSIVAMFTVPGQDARLLARHDELKELVGEIYKSVGLEVPEESVSSKKKNKHTREAERKKKRAEQVSQMKSGAGNPFALLDQ